MIHSSVTHHSERETKRIRQSCGLLWGATRKKRHTQSELLKSTYIQERTRQRIQPACPSSSVIGGNSIPCNLARRSSSLRSRSLSVSLRRAARLNDPSSSSSSLLSSSPFQLPLSKRVRPVASLACRACSSAAFLLSRWLFQWANVSGVTGVRVPVSLCRSDSSQSSRVSVVSGDLSRRAFSAALCSLVLRMNLPQKKKKRHVSRSNPVTYICILL